LTEKGVEFETVNYLEKPLSAPELKKLLKSAGLSPRDVLRKKEAAGLVTGVESDEELIRLMAAHPEIIQRPIVVKGGKAVLARPVENLKNLGI
jgi:arsenate reductase (glutaredoxin)